MFSLMTVIRRRLVLASACGALILPGCAGEDEAFSKRFPVTGNVTYNGQPLEKGTISFVPEGKGAGASGSVEKGAYKLSTGGEADGALPGKYKVTVMAKEDSEEKAKAEFAKVSKRPLSEITAVPRQFLAEASASAKNLVPAGYGDVRTTSLAAEVKTQAGNTFDFAMSDKDAPTPPAKSKGRAARR